MIPVFNAVLYERLDRAESRCEEREGYSFTACYKVRVIRRGILHSQI